MIKIKTIANDYGVVDFKDVKSFIETYGLDREKLKAAIKRMDLSQRLLLTTSVGNITIRMNYEIKDLEIITSPKVREAFAKQK